MKVFKSLVGLMALTMALTACGSAGEDVAGDGGNGEQAAAEVEETAKAQEETATESEEEFILGFDLGNSIYPYCVLVGETVESYGKEKGITVILTDCGGDVNVQNDNMENYIIQDADVISGIYQDKDGAMTSVYLAQENNVPIISCCQFIVGADEVYDSYIFAGSENYDGGYLMGEWMAEKLPENANILYCKSKTGDAGGEMRYQGMEAALKENGREDVTILDIIYTNGTRDGGVSAMEDWLNMYDVSEITCVAGVADDPVLGALEAAKAAGVADQIMFIGLDASEAALESIEAGEMEMSVFQNAVAQGKAVVDLCVQIRNGEDPAQLEDVYVPYETVTAENVADYWQYYK